MAEGHRKRKTVVISFVRVPPHSAPLSPEPLQSFGRSTFPCMNLQRYFPSNCTAASSRAGAAMAAQTYNESVTACEPQIIRCRVDSPRSVNPAAPPTKGSPSHRVRARVCVESLWGGMQRKPRESERLQVGLGRFLGLQPSGDHLRCDWQQSVCVPQVIAGIALCWSETVGGVNEAT